MGAAVLGALTGEHRTTGTVERVWERNGTFGKGVGVAGLGSALDGLGTLHVLPLFQILILDEEAFVDIAVDNDIAEQVPYRSGRLPERRSYRCTVHRCCRKRL